MIIKGLIDEDIVNYKKPSMQIATSRCSFKCDKESGVSCCQNSSLANEKDIEIGIEKLVKRYLSNPISKAVVFCGLEPLDTWDDTFSFIRVFREQTDDDIVIYTGYTEQECADKIEMIQQFRNIIVKFGRFIPNRPHHFDEVLGVELASENQYGRKIS